jgi:hypothetical protein
MAVKSFDMRVLERVYALILGESGAGKTHLLGTIPKDKRMLVVSAENGLLTIRDLLIKRPETVKAITVENWRDVRQVISTLKKEKTEEKYDIVAFDSLTAIADQRYRELEIEFPGKEKNFDRYGALASDLDNLLITLRDMTAYSILVTCLAETNNDPKQKERLFSPLLPGQKIKDKLAAYFDVSLFVMPHPLVKDGSRIVITDKIEGYPAKDRSNALDYEEEPDLTKMFAKMFKKYAEGPEYKKAPVTISAAKDEKSAASTKEAKSNG